MSSKTLDIGVPLSLSEIHPFDLRILTIRTVMRPTNISNVRLKLKYVHMGDNESVTTSNTIVLGTGIDALNGDPCISNLNILIENTMHVDIWFEHENMGIDLPLSIVYEQIEKPIS